ncbi:MAG: hypothetical protein V3V19_06245, partial [Cocleimonas sp.]
MKKHLPLMIVGFGILIMLVSIWLLLQQPTSAEELPDSVKTSAITPTIESVLKTDKIQFPAPTNSKASLGINTNEIYEQDASIPFIDLFRVAAPFHENIRCRAKDKPCLTSASVEYDKQGWPKKLNSGKAGVFFIRNIHRDAFPKGEYTVLYEGEGKIKY